LSFFYKKKTLSFPSCGGKDHVFFDLDETMVDWCPRGRIFYILQGTVGGNTPYNSRE